MPNIFTRSALNRIMTDESLTPEQRTEQVYGLYGRALEDGYIARGAARQAQEAALEQARSAWDPRESDAYRALQREFDAYRAMQTARGSEAFAGVKPKFFEAVYAMLDRGDGAKPVPEQLARIREEYEEYFSADAPRPAAPRFGAPTEGSMPKGEEGIEEVFRQAWRLVPKR